MKTLDAPLSRKGEGIADRKAGYSPVGERDAGKRRDEMGTQKTTVRFQQGDRVTVKQHSTAPRESSSVKGRYAEFVEYTQPNGYARVIVRGIGLWLVHPENLHLQPLCAVEGCGLYHLDLSDYCANHG